MKQFPMKKLSVLISLGFATSIGQAETPFPTFVDPATRWQERGNSAADAAAVPPVAVKADGGRGQKGAAEAAALLQDGPGIAAGGFLLYPELKLTQTYDTNIFAQPVNEVGNWISTPSASLYGRSTWSEHKVGFDIGADTNRYSGNSSQNVHDFWLGVDGRYDLSPGNNVFGGMRYSREHEDRGSANPQFGASPTIYYLTKAHVGTALRSGSVIMRLGASAEDLNYVSPSPVGTASALNNDDRDQLQHSIGARIGYEVSSAFVPFFQVSSDTRSYNNKIDDFGYQRSSSGYRASIGALFTPSAIFSSEVFLGSLSQRYDDNRFADVTSPYFGANLIWRPQPNTRLRALVDRALEETTIPNASGFLDTTVAIDAEHALSRNLVATARLAYSWNDFLGISRSDKITDASTGFRYYVDPAVFVGVDMRIVNRDSSDQSADYFRNQFMFTLGYAPGSKRPRVEGSSSDESFMAGLTSAAGLHGFVSPKIGYFSNSGNSAYLNRYDYLKDSFGSSKNGFIADLDFSLIYGDQAENYMLLEHRGFGVGNQALNLVGSSRSAKLSAYYSSFTSATGTFGYLYNPDQVVGGTDSSYTDPLLNSVGESQHVGYFNNDSPNTVDYEIKRSSYGASALLRPAAFNDRASVELSFDGYKRDGRQIANYVLDSHSLTGADRESNQWRGFANTIDDQASRITYNFSLSPRDDLLINYEFALGKYQNKAPTTTFNTVAQWGAPTLQFDTTTVDLNTPLFFTPDSTLYSNSLSLSKQFGSTAAVSAGVGVSRLEQNTFSATQAALGYNTGRIDTENWYLSGRFNPSQSIGLEAFARYNGRENNSSYPVSGFYEPVSTYADPRMVMPRINKLTNLTYGLEAKLYPRFLKTSWSVGWRHEKKDRDLAYATVPAITPQTSLYGAHYSADEVYLKMVARPARGWTVRITPSYLWANVAGPSSTDPNERFKLKTSIAYTKPEWSELAITGYYNYTQKINDTLSYSDYSLSPAGFTSPQNQVTKNKMQSFGVNMSLSPAEELKLNLAYDWSQNDFSTNFFSTNRLRFDYPIVYSGVVNPHSTVPLDFILLDRTTFDVTNHTISAGIEKRWSRYTFSGNFSLNWAKGQNAEGLAGQTLPAADKTIDSQLRTLSLGVEYALRKDVSVRGIFAHDNYKDKVSDALSGSRNVLWMGLNYRF